MAQHTYANGNNAMHQPDDVRGYPETFALAKK